MIFSKKLDLKIYGGRPPNCFNLKLKQIVEYLILYKPVQFYLVPAKIELKRTFKVKFLGKIQG